MTLGKKAFSRQKPVKKQSSRSKNMKSSIWVVYFHMYVESCSCLGKASMQGHL